MKKVLVTGGAGFIGSHLVDLLLEKGNDVAILDNLLQGNKLSPDTINNVLLINGDIRDYDTLKKAANGCTKIYHLAAMLGVDIVANEHVETMEIESIGLQNIIKITNHINIEKIVYASTSGVYGKSAFDESVNEDFILDPRTSYSIAKRFNEIYLKSLWFERGIVSSSIRYFNVYGPRQDTRMVIPRFIDQARRCEAITVYGDGNQTRDFTFVRDTVRITADIGEKLIEGSEIYNLCGDNETSIIGVAQMIKNLVDSKSEIQIVETPKSREEFEVRRRSGSTKKLDSFLGKQLYTSFDDGLLNTINYDK